MEGLIMFGVGYVALGSLYTWRAQKWHAARGLPENDALGDALTIILWPPLALASGIVALRDLWKARVK